MKKFWKWVGYIIEVTEDTFWAHLEDKTDPTKPDMEAEIPKDQIRERDREWIQVGAYFSFYIRYYEGEPDKESRAFFHFIKARWTEEDVQRAKERATELSRFFVERETTEEKLRRVVEYMKKEFPD